MNKEHPYNVVVSRTETRLEAIPVSAANIHDARSRALDVARGMEFTRPGDPVLNVENVTRVKPKP